MLLATGISDDTAERLVEISIGEIRFCFDFSATPLLFHARHSHRHRGPERRESARKRIQHLSGGLSDGAGSPTSKTSILMSCQETKSTSFCSSSPRSNSWAPQGLREIQQPRVKAQYPRESSAFCITISAANSVIPSASEESQWVIH